MRFRHPSHATVVAYVALFFAMSGTAIAATGGTFILGKSNYAGVTTTLTNPNGTALRLQSKSGTPPLSVNSNVRIPSLNSDLLDGLQAADFLRLNGKAKDANLLDGVDSSQFLRITGRAADSSLLGGLLPRDYQRALQNACPSGTFIRGVAADGSVTCGSADTPASPYSGGLLLGHAGRDCPIGTTFKYLIPLTDSEGFARDFQVCEID